MPSEGASVSETYPLFLKNLEKSPFPVVPSLCGRVIFSNAKTSPVARSILAGKSESTREASSVLMSSVPCGAAVTLQRNVSVGKDAAVFPRANLSSLAPLITVPVAPSWFPPALLMSTLSTNEEILPSRFDAGCTRYPSLTVFHSFMTPCIKVKPEVKPLPAVKPC